MFKSLSRERRRPAEYDKSNEGDSKLSYFDHLNQYSKLSYILKGLSQQNKKKVDRARKRWKLLRNIFIAFRLKCKKKEKSKVRHFLRVN